MNLLAAQQRLPRPALGDLPLLAVTALLALPLAIALLGGLFAGGGETWRHVLETQLLSSTTTTLFVLVLTGSLVLAMALPAAWLVTMYEFPGRGVFEWLLILPLAAPGYVLAIAYSDLLGVAGPLQSFIRDVTGLGARDYWFPDIHSAIGLSLILAAALFPYVFITARAAFTTTSICTLDAARTLGARPWTLFWQVGVPTARPAIAAGLALVLMEAAADYGAAAFLGVRTLTVGLFRAWASFGDAATAARMAVILFLLAIALQWLERRQRGTRGSEATSKRWQTLSRKPLRGGAALAAAGFCVALFALGFAIPVLRLIWLSLEAGAPAIALTDALVNSVLLAGIGAGLAFLLALTIALGLHNKRPMAGLGRLAAAGGYAVPGAVLALGAIIALGSLSIGLAGPVALAALVWVYLCRFTAAGTGPLEAALARAPASMDRAARSLGAGPARRLLRVDLPVAMAGAFAAALILFVEILKELPATLMLRPFNWETLAVRAYGFASDERLAEAALPCLMITLAGLLPVILLSAGLARARPGGPA